MKIHVCSGCEQVCVLDGREEHLCANPDCLYLHLPSPKALLAEIARREEKTAK